MMKIGSRAKKIVKKTKKFCIETTFAYPLVIKTGRGCFLEDIDGNKFLDFNANVSSCNVGYNHPEIVEVLKKYTRISPHKIAGQDFYSEEQADLAEKLVKITPKNMTRVLFSNSGTEAVENSIKICYRKKGPLAGVSCIDGFHGRTIGALSFTNSKAVHKKNYPEVNNKRIKFCVSDDDSRINDLEELLKKDSNIAFVIVEPVQGEGGYRIASEKFMKTLRKVTKNNNIPLIFDEVQSGLGRTGKWWAFEHYSVEPDIMAVAKSLQVGATILSKEYDPKERGALASTWGGGQKIDLAVGLKTIEIIEKENLMRNAERMGKYMLKRLREIEEKYSDKISNTRGLGLMLALDFQTKKEKDFVEQEAFKQNLILLGCGFSTIRISPPLIISEKEADEGLGILESVIKKLK